MRDRIVVDLGRMMDEIFETAEQFGHAFKDKFNFENLERGKGFRWDESTDYYPAYMYPPLNVYMRTDRTLVFEFALAGFDERDIRLEFKGDYMVFSARVSEEFKPEEEVRYFKRRLKIKDIEEQRYYVPEDKFDRERVKAVFRSGILRVSVPPKESPAEQSGIKVEIVREE